MTDIVKNNRERGGNWAKVRLEAWVRIDETTVQESGAALLNSALSALVFPQVAPAETVVVDSVSFFVDTSYMGGETPENQSVWSYCPECGRMWPLLIPNGVPANCERCGSNWQVAVQ